MKEKIRVAICGIQGYVGRQLLELVLGHPHLDLIAIFARKSQAELYHEFSLIDDEKIPVYSVSALPSQALKVDLLFLATPVEVSMELVKRFNANMKIIDLSGAFRLPAEKFQEWYGLEHQAPEYLMHAIYGLSPWSSMMDQNNLIANPGCYATCALMTLIPLIKSKIIESTGIVIDAKSGVSGAGKNSREELMFNEMSNNFFPYKVGHHQHIPEIQKGLKKFADTICDVTFVTHMLPISRGISMSIYADAANHFDSDVAITSALKEAYQQAYLNYPLIKFDEINAGNSKKDQYLLSIKSVVETAEIHIGFYTKNKKVMVFACIDNLMKGAASQAIENLNSLYDYPLETGLKTLEVTS